MNVSPKDPNHPHKASSPNPEVTEPPDFHEGRGDHRKSVLASTAFIFVLLMSSMCHQLNPELFGIGVPPLVLWLSVGVAHFYFVTMWRLTAFIEDDKEKRFWNWKGFRKQATLGGTQGHPGKDRMQSAMIRALPIWAFFGGLAMMVVGLAMVVVGLWGAPERCE